MDVADIFRNLVGLAFLLFLSAFFSSSETALTALTVTQVHKLKEERSKKSQAVIRFINDPRRLFISVLFGNILINMAFVSITGMLIFHVLFRGDDTAYASLVSIVFQTFILLIFGEITPKTYALNHPERLARMIAQPLWLFSILIYPVRKALSHFMDLLLPLFGVTSLNKPAPLTSEEIKVVLERNKELGAFDKDEGEILHNIFEFHDIQAKEVMVPRTEMMCIDATKTIQKAFLFTKEAGYSRLPVYRKDVDNIIGIFYVKDLPRWKGLRIDRLGGKNLEQLTIEEFLAHRDLLNELNPGYENTLIRLPFFTIRSKRIGELIRELAQKKQQMAIVLGEYGGTAGLVTTEDIVEEVLGEIFDEYDKVSEMSISRDRNDPGSALIPGFVSIRSVNKRLNLNLDLTSADTIGGYVITLFGCIPNEGDRVNDPYNGLEFIVERMAGARIDLIRVRLEKDEIEKNSKTLKPNKYPFLFLLFLCVPFFGGGEIINGNTNGYSIAPFLFLLILSVILSAFYSGAETAVVSASRAKIEVLSQQRDKRAAIISNFWKKPDDMLSIILVGNNLVNIIAGLAGLQLIGYIFPENESLQGILNTFIMTFFILIFCEILPKTIFRVKADTLALRSAYGLWLSAMIFRPVVVFITRMTNRIAERAEKPARSGQLMGMREELTYLARMGAKEGVLKPEQIQMISSVMDLETKTAEMVMTPLVDIVTVPKNITVESFYKIVADSGYTRIPVYEGRGDNLIGIVNVLDVIYTKSPSSTIAPYIKNLRHVPETKKVYSLLRELKKSGTNMVFVVDEFGGIVGLVTIEDLVEEVLGDIYEEKTEEEERIITQVDKNIYECDGKAEISVLKYRYNIPVPTGDYKTIAGYLIYLLEKIPRSGEVVETESVKMVVLDADLKSIKRVRIIIKK
ncbi:MAG: HlyC/CorC family transporter [Candidatus Aminicenantes bacterium]|nr:HlyC/CorC family transporter [Candidatus Aminicenantes bacterium]